MDLNEVKSHLIKTVRDYKTGPCNIGQRMSVIWFPVSCVLDGSSFYVIMPISISISVNWCLVLKCMTRCLEGVYSWNRLFTSWYTAVYLRNMFNYQNKCIIIWINRNIFSAVFYFLSIIVNTNLVVLWQWLKIIVNMCADIDVSYTGNLSR